MLGIRTQLRKMEEGRTYSVKAIMNMEYIMLIIKYLSSLFLHLYLKRSSVVFPVIFYKTFGNKILPNLKHFGTFANQFQTSRNKFTQ